MVTISPFLNPHPLPLNPSLPTLPQLSLTRTTTNCGPRSNRGPILRGRILSTEAILAVQSLKRSSSSNPPNLSHLLKSDILAAIVYSQLNPVTLSTAITELNRQNLPHLSLLVLSSARAEPWFSPDPALYAGMVKALPRSGLDAEIDDLVRDFVGIEGKRDLRGPAPRLVKALMEAGKAEVVMAVYGMMKRGKCVPDEYLFKFMVRGLRMLGDEEGAKIVETDYHVWCAGGDLS